MWGIARGCGEAGAGMRLVGDKGGKPMPVGGCVMMVMTVVMQFESWRRLGLMTRQGLWRRE